MKQTNTLKRLNAVMKDINGDNTQILRALQNQIIEVSFICRPPSQLQKGKIGGMTGNKEFTPSVWRKKSRVAGSWNRTHAHRIV